jgi:Na+/melibiose symporter-like transporter
MPEVAAVPARVPWPTRLAYSLGNVCETVLSRAFEVFVLFYYTQVCGLSGTLAGTAILVAMVVDAITDPLVGAWSDSLKTRFGRRHAPMFFSALPTALFFVALFAPPAGLAGLALAGWLAFTAVGLRVALTFFHIPWSTQIAELSPDLRERVTLAVMRNIFSVLANIALVAVAFDVFFVETPEYPRGQENPAAYLPFAAAIAGTLIIVILASAAGTWRRMQAVEQSQPRAVNRFSLGALWPAWRDIILRFRNFRCLMLGSLFLLTAFSVNNALALYLGGYFWGLGSEQIKQWQFAWILGGAVTLIVGKPIVDRVPLAPLFTAGIGIGTFMFALPVLLRLLGLLPGDPAAVMPVLLAANGVAGLALGLVMIVSGVISSETADDYEHRTGIKATALLFGFVFLAMKTAGGLGKLLAGAIIDIIRLPSADAAATITPAQLAALGWWCAGSLLVLGVLGVVSFSGYRSPAPRPAGTPVLPTRPAPQEAA